MNKIVIGLFCALFGSCSVVGQPTPPMITLPDEHIIISNLNSKNISLKHTIGSGLEAWFIEKETVPGVAELLSVASTISYNGSHFPFKGTARIIISKPPIKIDTNLTFNTNITTQRALNSDFKDWKKKQIKQLLSPYNKRDLNTLESLANTTLDKVIDRWQQLIIYIKDATNSQIQGNPIKMQEGKLKGLSRELKDF